MLCQKNLTKLTRAKFSAKFKIINFDNWLFNLFWLFNLGKRSRSWYTVIELVFLFIEKHHFKNLIVWRKRCFIGFILRPIFERLITINYVPFVSLILRIKRSSGLGLRFVVSTVKTFSIFILCEANKVRTVMILIFASYGFCQRWRRCVFFTSDWAIHALRETLLLDQSLWFHSMSLTIMVYVIVVILRGTNVI